MSTGNFTSPGNHGTTHRFTVIFEKGDDGAYHVFCPTLPGCPTQSETLEEGISNIREAIQLYVETLIEDGLPIPEEDILIQPIKISAWDSSSVVKREVMLSTCMPLTKGVSSFPFMPDAI